MWTLDAVNGTDLDMAEVTALYRASGLAERRPVDDTERFTAMVRNANLTVVARDGDRLIGIARCITDGAYTTYLSDLAVDAAYQRRGIGVDLIRRVQEAAPQAKVVLLSAPAAAEYYPHVGFTRHGSAWVLNPAG